MALLSVSQPKNNASISVIKPKSTASVSVAKPQSYAPLNVTTAKPQSSLSVQPLTYSGLASATNPKTAYVNQQMAQAPAARDFYRLTDSPNLIDAKTRQVIGATEFGKGAGFNEVANPYGTYKAPALPYSADPMPQNNQAPETPQTPAYQAPDNSNYVKAYQDYINSLGVSPEVTAAREKYLNFIQSSQLGQQALTGRAVEAGNVPTTLLRGQQERLLNQDNTTAGRLQGDIDLAQGTMEQQQAQGLARVGMEESLLSQQQKQYDAQQPTYTTVDGTLVRINPTTGQVEPVYQNVQATDTLDLQKRQLEILKLQSDIENSTDPLDKQIKQAQLAKLQQDLSGETPTSPYQVERAARTVQSVNELLTKVDTNPGIFGRSAAAPIPDFLRSDAYRNFEGELNTLKSNIAFGELTAMREASKTGGALGQVSDREGKLLESSLGALSMTQSSENIKAQLKKINDSITRWQEEVNKSGSGGNKSYTPEEQQLINEGATIEEINYLRNLTSDLGTSVNGPTAMRTDRHNNPAAFTTDIAKQAGLVEDKDYIVGDAFPNNPNLKTAKLLGDAVAQTIKVIDRIGFQTQSGKPRWSYINMPKDQWNKLSYEGKKSVIAFMYKNEGGSQLKQYFS